ncbi:aspartate racemase [Desulfonema ishimotonii]|uniref:Aspartate racemase n=1 Tax=Desulfonema ishimotonii TaxID=45657 RepID=A0A401FSX2_9BACT|nr:aspartate/glutamate racemase family protein [Desulfonema ishimotonii]GBC60064.1 aspartate racemase [Desulfonema ishimotonii]
MKTIGLLGGMSWESTVSYYRAVNEGVKARLGGWHSARIVMHSVDFQEIETLQRREEWDRMAALLGDAAQGIEAGGADFLVICTNTMHNVAPQIEEKISIPLLHIADATAEKVRAEGYRTVGLLGTNFTMAQDFYKGRLLERYGIKSVVPDQNDREIVHRVIFDELCLGKIRENSRREYQRIISGLAEQGAEAVVLGCTEIALLIQQVHTTVPLLDTARIHAEKAVEWALV